MRVPTEQDMTDEQLDARHANCAVCVPASAILGAGLIYHIRRSPRSDQFGRESISRPPHAEHRSLRPTSGTGVSAGHRCTSSTPSWLHFAHVATTKRTPFSADRELPKVR